MRIVIAGSSGLIGAALCRAYASEGHGVLRLVRREPRTAGEARWDPSIPEPRLVDGADAVINLAGAGIGAHRWTGRYRETIRTTRVVAAHTLATAAARAASPPRVLLCASGIRFYGIDRGDEVLTESSAPGTTGLMARIAREWEAATTPASDAGVRVCHLRLGLVLSRRGGLLPPLLRLFRLGVGAYFGSGREYWSYVSLADTVGAVRFLAANEATSGPYNVSAPNPARNRDLLRVMARLTGTRVLVRLPVPVLRMAIGGIATEVFGGLRVMPARLQEAGFTPAHADVEAALRAALSD